MTNLSNLRVLWDGDTILYACGFAADSQVLKRLKEEQPGMGDEWYKEQLQQEEYVSYALANARSVIEDVCNVFSNDYTIFLTGQGNFREHMATLRQYKGNRDPNHKPKYYKDLKQYLLDVHGAVVVEGKEADDELGCCQMEAEPDTTVIVSIDKDLDNIPGHHYNWRKKEYYYVDQATADKLYWTQVLTGDTTDNIPGIPKVGPKTADKILDGKSEWFDMAEAVLAKYIGTYGEIDGFHNFYENASLLWIQRERDKNFDDNPYRFRRDEDEQQVYDCEEDSRGDRD